MSQQSAQSHDSVRPPRPPLVLDPNGADWQSEFRTLRDSGSAVRVDILGVTAWSVADPALLKQLLTSPDVSKDARTHWPDFGNRVTTWPLALWVAVQNMFTAYGGDHRRLRRLISPTLSARRIAALAPMVEQTVSALLDGLAPDSGDTVVDLRQRLAYPLPITVISHLLGVADEQTLHFRQVVDGIFDTTLTQEQQAANNDRLFALADELIVAKRATPGDDMTSLLIAARDDETDGSGLTHPELRDTIILLISAGYETTVNVIDEALVAMLTHPRQLTRVRAGEFRWEDVAEETLRLQPALKFLPLRFAVGDLTLPDGQTIRRGEAILPSYGPANRHPDWHGDTADAFDVSRLNKEHLAFGHGVHFCLGAPLARMEVAEALRGLFTRYPDVRLAVPHEELRPLGSMISNGHQALPVRLGVPGDA
ncbi:cytochrome P450 [Streptomyces sp. NPDC088789]|uniref:cytochrome P450 family protein n=1 Tax=Streptomyces sp. NPDC088789 TaxID=3365899 RepID=UPI0037F608FC